MTVVIEYEFKVKVPTVTCDLKENFKIYAGRGVPLLYRSTKRRKGYFSTTVQNSDNKKSPRCYTGRFLLVLTSDCRGLDDRRHCHRNHRRHRHLGEEDVRSRGELH